jgi:hypothetical protein
MRDTCFHILTKLAPIANITSAVTDVQLEPPNILPSYPTLRPADIGLQLIPTPNMQNTNNTEPFLALDITFTHISHPRRQIANSSDRPEKHTTIAKVHDESAMQKFNVPHAFALLTHNVIILPMTYDHLGGIGSFAADFFFGTSQQLMHQGLTLHGHHNPFHTIPMPIYYINGLQPKPRKTSYLALTSTGSKDHNNIASTVPLTTPQAHPHGQLKHSA